MEYDPNTLSGYYIYVAEAYDTFLSSHKMYDKMRLEVNTSICSREMELQAEKFEEDFLEDRLEYATFSLEDQEYILALLFMSAVASYEE